MGAGLHFVAVLVLYGNNLNLDVVARRLHDFNLVAYEEFVLLLNIRFIAFGALYGAAPQKADNAKKSGKKEILHDF